MEFSTQTERNFFKVFLKGWNSLYDDIQREAELYFQEQMALGRNPRDILVDLEESRDNGLGLFRKFAGRLEGRVDYGINTLFQIASNAPMEQTGELMLWKLDPYAEHCDSCKFQSQQGPRPFSEIPWPGSQPTVGKTNCEIYCKCQIVPAKESNLAS